MAKYSIVFSCGHEERIELLGPVKDRERKIAYFQEQGLCSECYRKQRQAKQRIKPTSRIKYAEYKAKDLIYEAIKDTYNADDKTIEVMLKDLYLLETPIANIQLVIDSAKAVKYIVNNKISSKDALKESDYYTAYPSLDGKPIEDIDDALTSICYKVKSSTDDLLQSGKLIKCESLEEFMVTGEERG